MLVIIGPTVPVSAALAAPIRFTASCSCWYDFYIHIFAEADVMYTQATGQQKIALVATAENKFTLKGTDIKLTLNSAASGEVESLTLHQNGDHPAKKVEWLFYWWFYKTHYFLNKKSMFIKLKQL